MSSECTEPCCQERRAAKQFKEKYKTILKQPAVSELTDYFIIKAGESNEYLPQELALQQALELIKGVSNAKK